MRTLLGKDVNELKKRNYYQWLKPDVTCNEVSLFKNEFNQSEPIIVRLLQYYFGDRELNNLQIFWGARYKGMNGCNQELDITIEEQDKIFFGLSIKSRFGGGRLEPNDLSLTILNEFKNEIKKFEPEGYVNDVLQDMARLKNIKDATNDFKSVTILFDVPHQKKWVTKMSELDKKHKYIFLKDNNNYFFEELEDHLPDLIRYKQMTIQKIAREGGGIS